MSSMNKESIVLKSDGAGRVQAPLARQVELVREFPFRPAFRRTGRSQAT